jgi:hypothetical protein
LLEVAEGVCGNRTATGGAYMAGVDWDGMDWYGLACDDIALGSRKGRSF